MDTQKKYKQTWNRRSQKYVLIDCSEGIKGGFTGKMQQEPFEGVPIVNDKPAENGNDKHQNETPENRPAAETGAETGSRENEAAKKEAPEPNSPVTGLDDKESGEDDSWLW